MARLEEWKPTVCEEADGNAGLDRLQLASKRHLQRVSKSGLLKKFLVEEQNGISIKWDFSVILSQMRRCSPALLSASSQTAGFRFSNRATFKFQFLETDENA